MSKVLHVFISSKMQELHEERRALETLLPTLSQDSITLHPWVFESDAPASHQSIRQIYLEGLGRSSLYIGIFWNEYGEWTIDEFHRAGELGIERHIYVKNVNPEQRDPRLTEFLNKQSDVRFGITPRWFTSVEDLKAQITKSVEKWLLDRQLAHHSATNALLINHEELIPGLPKKLIGRENLLEQALELLHDNEHVLLHGFGGMGKSALAATIAAEWIEAGSGQILWLKAGNASADELFEAIGRAFDEQPAVANTSGDERIQTVRRILADQKGLPVLDDTWNGHALAQFDKAIPRKMPLLVTSRQRFPLDYILDVGALNQDQALKLLGYYGKHKDLSSNRDALKLCELLGYHTFALEIASKTMRVYDISPAELLQRIQNSPHDLRMPANFGDLGRTGIKSLLDASIDALDQWQYDLFVLLGGMFEPTATPALLTNITGRAHETIQQTLEELDMRGLVTAQQDKPVRYYRLHNLAYSYAHTMFVSKGMSQQSIIAGCEQYTIQHEDDLAGLDVELSNILEAAELARRSGREETLISIMRSLAVDGPYFSARGFSEKTLELMRQAIDAATSRGQLEDAHYLSSKLGNAYRDFLGQLGRALAAYRDAYALAVDIGDMNRQAILLTVIGTVLFQQGKFEEANQHHAHAEAIARKADNQYALALILQNRGYQASERPEPDHELGRQLSDESAQLALHLGLEDMYFMSMLNRAASEHDMGNYADALATHEALLKRAKGRGNYPQMANALHSMGEDHHELGQREQAQQAFDQSLKLWREVNATAKANALVQYMREHDYVVKE